MGREAFLAEVRRTLPGTLMEDDGGMLLPRSAHEVAVTLRLAHRLEGVVAVPGSVQADANAVPMDLRRLGEVIAFDDVSRIVHVQAGVPVGALETDLLGRGLTLGLEGAAPEEPVGGWLAGGAPGARDHDDDPVDQLVAGLAVVLPDGREMTIRPAPRRAVGPDLVGAVVGARGRLGAIVSAHLVVRPHRPGRDVVFVFGEREAAEAARAWIRGRGVRPARTRIVKVAEGTALHVRVEGEGQLAAASLEVTEKTAREHGGIPYPAEDLPPPRPPQPQDVSPIVDLLAPLLR